MLPKSTSNSPTVSPLFPHAPLDVPSVPVFAPLEAEEYDYKEDYEDDYGEDNGFYYPDEEGGDVTGPPSPAPTGPVGPPVPQKPPLRLKPGKV